MNYRIVRFAAMLGLLGATLALAPSFADPAAEMPAGGMDMEHHHHNMDAAPSADGAFHRRFNDAEKWVKVFDDPERDAWQKPDLVIDALKLAPASVVADVGAGTGYFSVRLAKRIPDGKVFAADVEPDMVHYLGERAKSEHVPNLVPVQASADAANLPEAADLVLVVDTFHHIGNREAYFTKLRSSLKSGGRLAIIDFKKDSPIGPPAEYRFTPEKVEEELKAAGFTLAESHDFLPRQYFLVFKAS